MKIQKLKITNFKAFINREFLFGDLNEIVGENFKGKSSVAEAITVGLKGVNLEGSNRLSTLITKGKSKSTIEIEFIMNNESHKVLREITKKGTRLFYNGIELSQSKLDQLLKWGNTDTFLYVFLPLFATEKLKNKQGRDFFTSFFDKINPEQVLAHLDQSFLEFIEPYDTKDPDYLIKSLRDEIDKNEEELKYSKGMLDSYQFELEKPVPKKHDLNELVTQLEIIDEQIAINQKKAPPVLIDTTEIDRKIYEFELELLKKSDCDLLDTVELESELNKLREKYTHLNKSLKQLMPLLKAGDMCPTCTQVVSQEAEEQFIQRIQEERLSLQSKMKEVKKVGQSIADSLKIIEEENFSRLSAYNKNEKMRVDSIQQKLIQLNEKKKEAVNKNNEQLRRFEEGLPDSSELYVKRKEISNQFEELKKMNYQRDLLLKRKEELTQSIRQIKEKMDTTNATIFRYKERIKALFQYSHTFAELVTKQITQHFTNVSIELFQISKSTGEMKPTFKLLYNGTLIDNCSLSEKIRAGLEIGKFIKKMTGERIPTFIDNAESITHYDFELTESQLFTATVVKGKKLDVKVTNFEEVIKPSKVERKEVS